jgi:hypothetical protein
MADELEVRADIVVAFGANAEFLSHLLRRGLGRG